MSSYNTNNQSYNSSSNQSYSTTVSNPSECCGRGCCWKGQQKLRLEKLQLF